MDTTLIYIDLDVDDTHYVAVHGGRVSNSMVSIDFGNFSLANLTQGTNMLYR